MERARIVGWAHSRFGKLEEPDAEALMRLVAREALDHAGVAPDDVDLVVVAAMNNGFSRQDFQGALAGMAEGALAQVPALRVENACASGSAAIHAAMDAIAAGRTRIALVLGAEKMTATPTPDAVAAPPSPGPRAAVRAVTGPRRRRRSTSRVSAAPSPSSRCSW